MYVMYSLMAACSIAALAFILLKKPLMSGRLVFRRPRLLLRHVWHRSRPAFARRFVMFLPMMAISLLF
jgi:hypothetical protein